MQDVAFRLAAPVDAPTLSALAIQVFLGTYAEDGIRPSVAREAHEILSPAAFDIALADPACTIVVAEREGRLLGFAQIAFPSRHALVPHENAAELVRLYVQERSTRRGIGRELLVRAEEEAIVRGATTLWLCAWAPNLRALAFYERCGYALAGESSYRFRDDVYATRVYTRRLPAERP